MNEERLKFIKKMDEIIERYCKKVDEFAQMDLSEETVEVKALQQKLVSHVRRYREANLLNESNKGSSLKDN